GIGIGAGETVSNDLILSNAPAHQAGSASAISETAYEVGAVLGTAIIGGLLTAHFRNALQMPRGLADPSGADTRGGAVALPAEPAVAACAVARRTRWPPGRCAPPASGRCSWWAQQCSEPSRFARRRSSSP